MSLRKARRMAAYAAVLFPWAHHSSRMPRSVLVLGVTEHLREACQSRPHCSGGLKLRISGASRVFDLEISRHFGDSTYCILYHGARLPSICIDLGYNTKLTLYGLSGAACGGPATCALKCSLPLPITHPPHSWISLR